MLLGQWAVKVPATERPAAYRSLITLMSEQDAAVQLAAVSSPSGQSPATIVSDIRGLAMLCLMEAGLQLPISAAVLLCGRAAHERLGIGLWPTGMTLLCKCR